VPEQFQNLIEKSSDHRNRQRRYHLPNTPIHNCSFSWLGTCYCTSTII